MVQDLKKEAELLPIAHSIELQQTNDADGPVYVETASVKPDAYPDSTIYVDAEDQIPIEPVELVSAPRRTKAKGDADYRVIFKEDNNKKAIYQCFYCPKVFNYVSRLKLHLRTHTGEKPFACTMCPFTASYKKSVEIHMRSHTGEKPYSCNICSFRAARKANVDDHMRIHTGEKPYACPHCPFRSAQQSAVTCHIRRHTGEKRFACPTCGFRTAYKHILKAHIRVHTGERPFACSICPYRGTTKLNVKLHMRKHTGEKPYACTICSFRSTKRYAVKLHMRRHTGERPFACPECDYTASQKFSLQKHMRRHTGAAPFSCPECGYRCVNEKALSVHVKKHQKQQFACAVCGFTIRSKTKFEEHLCSEHNITNEAELEFHCHSQLMESGGKMVRPKTEEDYSITRFFTCDYCSFSTTSEQAYDAHQTIHAQPAPQFLHVCHHCNMSFKSSEALTTHVRTDHSVKKLDSKRKQVFVCPVLCSSTFMTKTELKRHLQAEHPNFSCKSFKIGPQDIKKENIKEEIIDELPPTESENPPRVLQNTFGKVVFTGQKGTVVTTKRVIMSISRFKR